MIFLFNDSPLSSLSFSQSEINTTQIIFFIGEAVSLLICLFFLKDKPHRIFDLCAAVLMPIATILMIFVPNIFIVYISFAVGGLAMGAVMFRILYKSFYFVPLKSWPVFIASAHIIIELLIYVFSIGSNFALEITLSFIVLIAGLIFHNLFKGDVLARRSELPDTKIKAPLFLYYFLFIAGYLLCSNILTTNKFPELISGDSRYYKIIFEAVAIAAIFLTAKYFNRIAYYVTAVALLAVSLILFQAFGLQHPLVVRSFADVAYIFYDVFLFSFGGAVFYKFGNKFYKLRAFVGLLTLAMLLPAIAAAVIPNSIEILPYLYFIIIILFLVLCIFNRKAGELDTHSFQQTDATQDDISTADPVILPMLDSIEPYDALTKREEDILRLILEKRDTDVIAYMSGISEGTTRTHISNICSKYGVNSKKELIILFGVDMPVLSKREEEVLELIMAGDSNETIAKKLFIQLSTVKTHAMNIYRKKSVKNRIELIKKNSSGNLNEK